MNDRELIEKNKKTGLMVLGFVLFMVGVSFAAVPAYRLFCQVTGFGGTTQVAAELPGTVLDQEVTVSFSASTARNMPWNFTPEVTQMTVKLGQRGLVSYKAHNPRSIPTGGTAIYNVTPLKAGKYFHKIQCFCFDQQILKPGEKVDMPVLFFVDPSMADDPNMDDVKHITLSYTFYEAESEELDQALEAYYQTASQ